MISPELFFSHLEKHEIDFFTGVPDSLLKDFCAYVTDHVTDAKHIITANEGNAIALAAGYYLATKKIGLVYLQNSGLGNTINPLLSLVDPLVYNIPVLVLIGWRGEPGKEDEPQHVKQGQVTLAMLEAAGVKYGVLSQDKEAAEVELEYAVEYMLKYNAPYALVVPADTFESYKLQKIYKTNFELNREEALKVIISNINENDIIISTTGKTSRELFEYREELEQSHEKDFLTVGSMGHALHIALGVALSKSDRTVYCIDGDGALLMHMGGLAIVGKLSPKNLKHIVINNGAHDSVGGQPTVGFDINMLEIAKACGYKMALQAERTDEIVKSCELLKESGELAFLEIKVNKGARNDLGRPTTTPRENKEAFMGFLTNIQSISTN